MEVTGHSRVSVLLFPSIRHPPSPSILLGRYQMAEPLPSYQEPITNKGSRYIWVLDTNQVPCQYAIMEWIPMEHGYQNAIPDLVHHLHHF